MTKISILDLVRISREGSARTSLDNAVDLARHAEALGFTRYWVAEHHNMDGVGSAATSIVIGHIAAGTTTIRVGAGGVMLPNHAPMVIAEQFGTLATLHPGRIDLGVGRAPGSDQITMRALRRSLEGPDSFPRDVVELQTYFETPENGQRLQAVPAGGTQVPVWILGSSTFGAQLAAELGLPYAIASHFAPDLLLSALELYRRGFKPSASRALPYAMIGVNVIAADTDEEAERLRTSQLMSFVHLLRGISVKTLPPIDDIETYWNPGERAEVLRMMGLSIIGAVDTVRAGLKALVAETGADELMVVSEVYDHSTRRRSYELIREAADWLDQSEG